MELKNNYNYFPTGFVPYIKKGMSYKRWDYSNHTVKEKLKK